MNRKNEKNRGKGEIRRKKENPRMNWKCGKKKMDECSGVRI